jgi:CMP-N,N'-diacetyllegionaminic acid synthase
MITAIVPARSGSKRLPGKNIRKLAGRPLIFHTIDSVLNHQVITKIIFTSDSEEYIDLAKTEYANKIDYEYRPSRYAGDNIKIYDELKRLIKRGRVETEWYMLCLPTCPLRNNKIVADLLTKWNQNHKPIFSAVAYDFPTQFAFTISKDNSKWTPITDDSPLLLGDTRSQDMEKTYRPNGAIFLQHIDNIKNSSLYVDTNVFIMNPEDSIDIDTKLDFQICESILKAKEKLNDR